MVNMNKVWDRWDTIGKLIGVVVFSAITTLVLFLAWRYFAPMFNLPTLTFWEIWLLKTGANILCDSGTNK